jgi:hypothetical protein
MALLCEIACVKSGGGVAQCFQQCGSNNQTVQAALCVANNCGVGTCL